MKEKSHKLNRTSNIFKLGKYTIIAIIQWEIGNNENLRRVNMKLLIISDLHFDENNSWDFINKITSNMVHRVKKKLIENEELTIIFLGDIINCGGIGNNLVKFSEADKFIDLLKNAFSNVKMLFIPGNHEIENNSFELSAFNNFCQQHSYKKDYVFTMKSSVFSVEEANVNLILVDSTLTRNHDLNGKIDIKALKSKMNAGKNIIFMHHPPCELEGADRSIINENELIATHSNFIFYGHQHGNVKVPDFLNNDTDIHSVGTLFKQEKGCSNEFLLLDITDGRINFAYRYIWTVTNFVANLLFPVKTNKISDHITLSEPDKKPTKIFRKLQRMSNSQKNRKENAIWYDYIGEDIIDVIKKHNLMLLLGDAGTGKSFELANIYWHYKNDDDYFPIWVNLRNTNYSDVAKYINLAQHNTIDRKIPLLIMDGLDEMDGGEIADLVKELGSATQGNSEVKILLSARTNYRVSIDIHFVEYMLLPLNTEQISTIAIDNGIVNTTNFLECLKTTDGMTLAQTPFYLFDMIRIYKDTETLPKREFLLDLMISYRFKNGDERFPCAFKDTLLANEDLLRSQLKELSFIMQSLHIFALKNKEYTRCFSSNIREFFNKTGLILCKESDHTLVWEFEHNIFREFLVAEYLEDISFDKLLEIITYDKNNKLLRPSWVNILSFLIPMRIDDCIISWLIDNAPETIYKFESDRITAEKRDKIFIKLMQDSFDKRIPIYALHEEERLAKFFQGKSALSFLIEVIRNPLNNASSLGAISILRYFNNFYDMETEIKNVIIPYLNIKQPDYMVSMSVKTLIQLFDRDLLILVPEVFDLLKDDERSEVIGALCKLFHRANVVDDYYEYLFRMFDRYGKLQESLSATKEFTSAIKSFRNLNNILQLIELFCSDESYQFYEINELFKDLIIKVFEMNEHEHNKLLNNLVKIFVCVSSRCDKKKSNIIKQLFIDYGLLHDAFRRILKLKIPIEAMMFSIEDIMEKQVLDILISSYLADEVNPETYKWYARRNSKDSEIFDKLNQAVRDKEGIEIKIDEAIDWKKIQQEGNQKYFDSLFDKSKFALMIDELIAFLGDQTLCEELLGDTFSKVPPNRKDLQNIRTVLYHNGNGKCKVARFLESVDWGNISINEISRMFQNHEQIEVSLAQQKYLETYFYNKIENVNFEKLSKTQFYIVRQIILLHNKFKFVIRDDKLTEMLMLPWYVFVSSTSLSDSETLNFVSQNISDTSKLRKKIIYNIKNKKLDPLTAHTHILYCANEELVEGVDIAIDLFRNTSEEARGFKNCTIDYLITVKGDDFVNNLVDETIDDDFLKYLSYKIKNKNDKIIAIMIKRNSESDDQLLFLIELLKLNNRYALEKYYNLAKEANTLPDLLPEGSHIEEITMAIREINDISLIDVIFNLIKLCFSDGFKDKENFGLRGSLGTVINNFIQVDKVYTKEMLISLINDCEDNERLISTCNWHLKNIEHLINVSSDMPWNLETTLTFLKSRKS